MRKIGIYDKVILVAAFAYLLVITIFMVWHQEFFSPDRFFVFAFLATVVMGQAWNFLLDWMPLVLLILGYEYLRGLVPMLTQKVNIFPMMKFDRAIFFGQVPTIWLQRHFFTDGHIRWYDNAAVILYFLHFVVPLMFGFILWLMDRKMFKLYAATMVVVSYAAFVTYYFFPAMPPWMASQQGFLPPVAHIMDQVLAHFAHPISLPTVYNYVGANLVAAVPSLHAAYPMIAALFVYKKFPRFGWLMFLYPIAMIFAVLYLGEHYFFDVVMAALYVLTAYAFITDWRGVTTGLWNKVKIMYLRFKVKVVAD
ncbi:MAG: phosphatase PAP2 family protein [Candidatus Doudnabacteria bacterium]|nr:phosphatase PAP2 family protein [Candidatus Doudnabacteria bacterium]